MSEPMDTIKQFNEAMAKIPLKDPSPSIPWRKPEERPEVGRELILAEAHCDPEKKPVLYEGRVTQNGEVYLPYTECEHKLESFLCWIYADEIPLPDWCLK